MKGMGIIMNPYSVLGIKKGASAEAIKEAYRELVKKYHPDRYAGNPLADLAEEKLKEINQAYEMLMNDGGSTGTNSYNESYSGSSSFSQIRQLISSGRIDEAIMQLNSSSDHGAEWNYLMGVAYLRKGWYSQAISFLQTAHNMEPSNSEYAAAYNNVNMRNNQYRDVGRGTSSPDLCSCCTQLYCADCCCECAGGDLISCC